MKTKKEYQGSFEFNGYALFYILIGVAFLLLCISYVTSAVSIMGSKLADAMIEEVPGEENGHMSSENVPSLEEFLRAEFKDVQFERSFFEDVERFNCVTDCTITFENEVNMKVWETGVFNNKVRTVALPGVLVERNSEGATEVSVLVEGKDPELLNTYLSSH